MHTYIIDGKKYNIAQDLFNKFPEVFKGNKNGRSFIKANDTPNNDYIFARLVRGEWVSSEGKSDKYDKVFFRKGYIEMTYVDDDENVDDLC